MPMPQMPEAFKNLPFWERAALCVLPLLVCATAWLDVSLPAESDKGWLLHVARLCLSGRVLYRDIVEVNPPLVIWVYEIPVWVSLHVGALTAAQALGLMGLLVSGITIVVCTRLIALHPAFAGNPVRQAEFALIVALVLIFFTTQLYFFDRDHIFLVLVFPYFVRFMPSLADRKPSLPLQLITSVMAAVGFCFKPHTIIVFAALQLFALLRKRSVSALASVENVVIVASFLLYALATRVFYPDYFNVILPMALPTYAEFANHGSAYAYLPLIFVSLGLVFADFRFRHATPYRPEVPYLVMLCLAFIAYALANNGWGYTYNPLWCMVLFTACWMLLEYDWLKRERTARKLSIRHSSFGIRGCLIALSLQAAYIVAYIIAVGFSGATGVACGDDPRCWRNSPYVRYIETRHIHSFGTLSFDFSSWVTLLLLPDVEWSTRFNHLWMVPEFLHSPEEFTTQHYWIITTVGKALAQDLDERKPDIVFVDASPSFMGHIRRFDLPGFFARVPEFKEAWSHYRFADTIDTCERFNPLSPLGPPSECRYDIFTRVP